MKAIVDKANADTAPLRNVVIGSQLDRHPARQPGAAEGVGDGQPRRRRDARRSTPSDGVQAAITNSGGLRQDILLTPSPGGEQPGQITWGEAFAVLPFGNSTVIETLTYEQLIAALANGFRPPCGDAGGTGRTPQYSGLWVEFHCTGIVPVIDNVWLAPPGPRPTTAPLGPGSTVRIVTNDFMFGGGDGYTALSGGTNVLQTGDLLLDVMIDYITAHSPVAPVVEGRITRTP